MMAGSAPSLLADVGGTHTRLALSDGVGRYRAVEVVHTGDFDSAEQAIADYLSQATGGERPGRAMLAVAGPVVGNRVRLTNADWDIDGNELARAFGFRSARLVNDFVAVARSLPLLGDDARAPLGDWAPEPRGAMVALGPGTGLGVAGLVPVGDDGWLPVAGEGGHVTLPVMTDAESAVLAVLRRRVDHVSAERVLSGIGLPALDAAIAVVEGEPPRPDRESEVVLAAARDGEARALRAVGMFVDLLATVAGDLALTFGATGGVYLAGGMPHYLGDLFDHGRFRARFEAKGRSSRYVRRIPTAIVTHPQPGLLGLSALVAE
ncbi:MAG: glucokinase [Thalassobaculum sp.]|uniref:glucokinase n=1 Tax=Thalassobaculum sp. TaxID=2022740 RepID=UPI0032EB3BF0